MEKTPDQWITKLGLLTLESREIPMWGSPPDFPWEEFSTSLGSALGVKDFTLSPKTADWKDKSTFLEGIDSNPIVIGIDCLPLTGHVHFIMPFEAVSKLSSWILNPDNPKPWFSDPDLQKGFCQFLTIQALASMDELQIYPELSPKIIEAPLPDTTSYVIDLSIKYKRKTLLGRLILSHVFQKSFKRHYQTAPILPNKLLSSIDAHLHLEAGYTELFQNEWTNTNVGDFVILDRCGYHPDTKKGIMQLTYLNTPLFQVKLKDDHLKILDYALYVEDKNMADKEIEKLPGSTEEKPGISKEIEEKVLTEAIEEESIEVPECAQPEELISPQNIPLTLTVEIARLKMSLDKLMKLKPGNVIDLLVAPEQGVHLTIDGKKVARGQLLRIGDVLGVKLTELGS